jgi:histidine triad (HIT) family protein
MNQATQIQRKGGNMADCIFCKIVQDDIPCFKIYEDENVLAFADINPINTGHTLIIPKNHADNIWEISEDDLSAIHRASIKVAKAMQASLNSDGIACLQLNGRAVNQLVMHYHLHLIPRKNDDPKLTITEWELVPGDMKLVEETANKIAAAVK